MTGNPSEPAHVPGTGIPGAVRADEGSGASIATLRAALTEGEQSGPSSAFDVDAFLARKRRQQAE